MKRSDAHKMRQCAKCGFWKEKRHLVREPGSGHLVCPTPGCLDIETQGGKARWFEK